MMCNCVQIITISLVIHTDLCCYIEICANITQVKKQVFDSRPAFDMLLESTLLLLIPN